ncbi:MAG: toprim domain-containing protein, partial [Patescibacteria group bacterium]|nr:toprim domain-containing protein [Patescibacteria group bacterium]
DVAGAPIAVSGRFFEKVPGQKEDGEPAKYVNSPETLIFKKARTLYGLDRARTYIRKADCILLVEGQFDLLLSHQSGLPFAVALSGTALTPEHLSILSRLSKRLVLALDADQAGLRAGLKSAHMALGAGFDVKIPTFPAGKDPADIAKENPELLKAAVRTSQTAIEFFLNALWPQAQDDRAYNKLVEAHVLPLVAALQSRIDQEHFIHTTAGRLSVPDSAVREEVNKIAGRTTPAPEETSPEVHHGGAESNLSSLELKIGMALAGWEGSKAKVQELLGADFERTTARLKPFEEELKFRFEREVHEETTAERVAQDMLVHVEAALKRAKMKSV